MTIEQAERPLTSDIVRAVVRSLRRATEDLGVKFSKIATELGVSSTKVEEWANEGGEDASRRRVGAHWPIYSLASSRAIPDRLFERIVADLRGLRAQTAPTLTKTAESAAMVWMTKANEAMGEILGALADGRISSLEARAVLQRVAEVESYCAEVRKALSHLDPKPANSATLKAVTT